VSSRRALRAEESIVLPGWGREREMRERREGDEKNERNITKSSVVDNVGVDYKWYYQRHCHSSY
jgi:hypothetical protein